MTDREGEEIIPGRVLRSRFRKIAFAQVVLVAAMAFAFWLMQQQQQTLEAEQAARTRGLCESTVTGRATQLMFADVLVSASQADGTTPRQQRQIEAFQTGVDERLLGELPVTCRGMLSLAEFRERVRLEAQPPPDPGALP